MSLFSYSNAELQKIFVLLHLHLPHAAVMSFENDRAIGAEHYIIEGVIMNDIAAELAKLHELTGAEFSRQVEHIAKMHIFRLVEGETDIFTAISESSSDYSNLLSAARKLLSYGYRIFLMPNPKGIRTPDIIVERKGVYRVYDLKTISGGASVINRLRESIGQCNQIILNMATNYNARRLAKELIIFFHTNINATEVLIFKRGKMMQVTRKSIEGKQFVRSFIISYER